MGMATVENKGRVMIPKDIREELGLRGGEKVRIELENNEIVMKPIKELGELTKLKGCVKESKLDPLKVKRIWGA